MNIFALNDCPITSAEIQHDKHVVKMVLESAQMLSSAYEKEHNPPYKRAYYNHPCTKWARQSFGNYAWLVLHALSLAREYYKRYDKAHASRKVIKWCWDNKDKLKFEEETRTPFAQAMPEEYKNQDSVQAYRDYYIGTKLNNNPRWTNRSVPKIFQPYVN